MLIGKHINASLLVITLDYVAKKIEYRLENKRAAQVRFLVQQKPSPALSGA
jgi:hypothetical protein